MRLARAALLAASVAVVPALAQETSPLLTLESINSASLDGVAAVPLAELVAADAPDPAVVRLQVLLDRAGASPGVVDGYDGENVRKAISALETMRQMPVDGVADADLLSQLSSSADIVARYTIVEADTADVTGPVPEDYSELAELDFAGYATVAEAIAEKFHMDEDLLRALNPDAGFSVGEEIVVAQPGSALEGEVARIEADRAQAQVRAYGSDGTLIVAYPATVGSRENPSPSGTHEVVAVAPEPNYTYDPETFVQGDNIERLILPPGPNNPVGGTWIDLSEPGYGIHGTPEPALIDKTFSHGCVRLTNWDAEELAGMVSKGVTVTFVQ